MGGFSHTDDTNTWVIRDRTYTLHTIVLPASESSPEASISCLLDPRYIPLLPNPPPQAHKPIENPCFELRNTPHKGIGLFATRDVAAGDFVMTEHPALILSSGEFPPELYDAIGDRLPAKRRSELLAMANCRSPEECKSHVEGIVRTNGLLLELDPKGKLTGPKDFYGGVYPLINRSNHSCGPNVGLKWDLSSLTLTMYALRAIRKGEEIHKTYLEPALPREKRISHLQKNYRFTCDCPWCDIRGFVTTHAEEPESSSAVADNERPFTDAEVQQIADSDERRYLLGHWVFTHLGYKKWSTDLARKDDMVIKSHLEALELIRIEGMEGLQNLFIEEIAMCYAMLGYLDAFREWGEKVVTLSRIEDPPAAKRFEEWLVDPPKRVKKWGWRKTQRDQQPGRRRLKAGQAVEEEPPIDALGLLFPSSDSDD
ncbi:SET domain-containing protein [Pholiota conissans]|uniref:SET domain-containing protein n=1 Tax=Pholiota conissans TaxID=109636 RepID=A0A9P5ZF97_9AGAR|nr:SET domain-containing protein [Pholiota conissans]